MVCVKPDHICDGMISHPQLFKEQEISVEKCWLKTSGVRFCHFYKGFITFAIIYYGLSSSIALSNPAMKEIINKSSGFNRIEFWAVSTLFVFVLFIYITDGLDGSSALNSTPYKTYFDRASVPFYFYYNYFIPQLVRHIFLFAAFLYLNFIVVPKLLLKKALAKNVFLVITIFLIAGLVFGITDTYIKGYLYAKGKGSDEVKQELFRINFLYAFRLLWSFAIYTVIKYAAIYLLTNAEAIYLKFRFITKEGIVAFVIWLIGLFLLITLEAEVPLIIGWMLVVLSGILLYLFSFYRLIPGSLGKRYYFGSYILKCVFVLAIAFIPVMLFILLFFHDDGTAFTFSFFNTVFQLFITAPITWTIYRREMKGNEEVVVLKKELGRSNASFDFLRSQINPHFLFNALNTLYGTALQEGAERTSEGIEKLGDMMRFML